MNVEQYFNRRSSHIHHCIQENRIYMVERKIEENKSRIESMKNDFTEIKNTINKLSDRIDSNMKSINAKFFTVMGTSIVLLISALGALVFFLLTR